MNRQLFTNAQLSPRYGRIICGVAGGIVGAFTALATRAWLSGETNPANYGSACVSGFCAGFTAGALQAPTPEGSSILRTSIRFTFGVIGGSIVGGVVGYAVNDAGVSVTGGSAVAGALTAMGMNQKNRPA